MLGGSYYVSAREEFEPLTNNFIKCQVILLDGNIECFTIQKKACGQYLLDLVFDTLELLERDFFGLQFKDSHPASGKYYKWLNGAKSIKKQLTGSQPYIFQFKVKFYPNNPNQMKEEYTRYLLYLQLKKDLLEEKLYCNQEMCAVLASYVLQSELGDFNSEKHKSGYISEFKCVKNLTTELEMGISDLHTKLKHLNPGQAENEFLKTATHADNYGVHLVSCLTPNKEIVQIGPSSLGFNVFKNRKRIHLFLWNIIFKISFKKKKITIQIKNLQSNNEDSNKPSSLLHVFILSSFPLCKTLWQNCVDYHTFFRVKIPSNNSQLKTNSKTKSTNFFGISMTPAFGGRRTMPSIEDIQKRSRTTERTFIRTPSTFRKPHLSRTNSNNHSSISQNSTVSRSSGTLSSMKVNESKKKILLTKFNSFQDRSQSQSQNSLEYKPLPATFDSDNSSIDDNDAHNDEYRDEYPDSGTFFLSEHTLNDSRCKDRTMSIDRTNIRTESSSSVNYHNNKRSIDLIKKPRFQMSIDKSMKDSTKLGHINNSMDSLSDNKLTSKKSASSGHSEKKVPYFIRLASSVNFHKTKPAIPTNGVIKKPNIDRSSSVDKFYDNDLLIKLRCDRNRRYGFTIRSAADRGSPIIINNIVKNTPADTCFPRLSVGDQLLSINGENVDQLTQEEVIFLIKKCADSSYGEIIIRVRPNNYMSECNNIDSSDWDFSIISNGSEQQSSLNSSKLDLISSNTDSFIQSLRCLEIAIENDDILQQFESVYRKKPGLTMIEAKKTENFVKNRYRDISPYDQTRVILKNSSSDYINASIINMQISDNGIVNRYIAAQGPLVHTSEDFWQMCWEQNTYLIVMLTALSEQGRPKCHKYWPQIYETVEFGDFQISCLVEEYSEDGGFAIRDLMVYRTASKEERRIHHMQYISWPDHGVPSVHYEFINFVYQVRKFRSGHFECIVVHCSAGIGRTGVLITMETAMCLIEARKSINIIEILQTMRDQRASMIQTPAQFKFVCEAILKVYKDSDIRAL